MGVSVSAPSLHRESTDSLIYMGMHLSLSSHPHKVPSIKGRYFEDHKRAYNMHMYMYTCGLPLVTMNVGISGYIQCQ